MSDTSNEDSGSASTHPPDQVETRAAHLLPEEANAGGSDDPRRQAELILEDSEIRSLDRDRAPDSFVEHRTSDEATAPVDGAS